MNALRHIPTTRLEAFSDGVIAIIITVMVFDLKLPEITPGSTVGYELSKLAPRFISYTVSFLMLSIMWVSHHQLFHPIKRADGKLLWFSIHHLFWMSTVPFGTSFLGANPSLWQAAFGYSMIFFMIALSFTMLRNYALKCNLLQDHIDKQAHIRIQIRNQAALLIYLVAAGTSIFFVYLSLALFLVVPTLYFITEKISHINAITP